MLLRLGMSAVQALRRAFWFFTRPKVRGVHAIALDQTGKLLLVKHRYTRGWHLPGGGLKKGEEPSVAILRELREEIGLLGHGSAEFLGTSDCELDYRSVAVSLFLIRGVEYKPRWSLEIERICAFELDRLPPDLGSLSRERVTRHIDSIRRGDAEAAGTG